MATRTLRDRAEVAADEMVALRERGDVVLAGEARRTLEEIVAQMPISYEDMRNLVKQLILAAERRALGLL